MAHLCYAGVATAKSALSTDSLYSICNPQLDVHGGRCSLRQEVDGEYHWRGEREQLLSSSQRVVVGPRSLISVASLCTAILPARKFYWSVVAR